MTHDNDPHYHDTTYTGDIPLSLAVSAHNGTSFVPDRRGEQEVASYAYAGG